jgi:hypothetical protein
MRAAGASSSAIDVLLSGHADPAFVQDTSEFVAPHQVNGEERHLEHISGPVDHDGVRPRP